MAKDPALLFYTSDFLTGTFTMSDEQVGKYIRLLCLQHQKGVLTEKDMLNICKTYDKDIFEKFKKNGDNTFYNERLKIEADRRKAYSKSRKENRESNKKTKKKDMTNISKTYDKHMETETETKTDIITEDETKKLRKRFKEIFLDFYFKKKNVKYYWEAKDGANLVHLTNKIKSVVKDNKPDATNKDLEKAFAGFLNSINHEWVLENLSIPKINSQYNEILAKIRKGRGTKGYRGDDKYERVIQLLEERETANN